jgi:hypothetical protein
MVHNAAKRLAPLVEPTFTLKHGGKLAAAAHKGVKISLAMTSEFFK